MTLIQVFQINERTKEIINSWRGAKLYHIPEVKDKYAKEPSGFDTITAELMKHRNTVEYIHRLMEPTKKPPYPFSTTSKHFTAVQNGKYAYIEYHPEVTIPKVKLSKNQVHVLIKGICDLQVFIGRVITTPMLPDYIGLNDSVFDYSSIIEILSSSLSIIMETFTLINEQYTLKGE